MYHHLDAIRARITDTRATGAPNRQLRFSAEIHNSTPEDLAFLSSSVRVQINNVEVADGDLLHVHTAPALGARVGAGSSQPAEIVVPITREALGMIEQHRIGDVEVSFAASVWIATVRGESEQIIAAPREQHIEVRFPDGSRRGIPQSRWLEFLRSFGFDETLLLELPNRYFGNGHPIARQRWEKAVDHYRRGDWEEVLLACRLMLEALAWEKTESGRNRPDMRQLRTFFDSSEKGTHLDTMTTAFSSFLHLGRHEQSGNPGVTIRQPDALLALSIAAGILRYISEQ